MKTVVLSRRSKHKTLHIEAPGCIINIYSGLHDIGGRSVTSVEVLPDQPDYEGRHWDGISPEGDIINYHRIRVARKENTP